VFGGPRARPSLEGENAAMPLLPLEPFLYPEDLLSPPATAEADPSRWWVLHTRPRTEKCLARRFLSRTLPFFLPLYKRQWRSRGRLLCSHVPLFPGYLFLRGDYQVRLAALETNLIVRCLPVEDQEQLQADLARVYHLMATGEALTPEDRLRPGAPVEIVHGPLAGLEGKVIRRGKQLKLFVEVQMLQRGVSVEIEGWMIQPLGDGRPALTGAACR
jgi:transcriptional antiterminator RfaH